MEQGPSSSQNGPSSELSLSKETVDPMQDSDMIFKQLKLLVRMLQHRRCRQTSTHVFLSLVGFIGDDVIEDDTTRNQSSRWMMDDGWMDDGFKGDDALEDDITRNHSG